MADVAPVVLRRALQEAGLVTIAICTLALATSSYVMVGMLGCLGSAIVTIAIVDV